MTETPHLRINNRYRNRGGWFAEYLEPPWPARGEAKGPPILVFYSFKGGVGRTMGLAAFALNRAVAGERVLLIDFDLDAPGAGVLLSSNSEAEIAPYGVVDYLLDSQSISVGDLRDYYHRYVPGGSTGDILVIPSGRLDEAYLGKLARVDLEPESPGGELPSVHASFFRLLEQARSELDPHWILIDARSGLSNAAGFLLRGMAHLHVLFGTQSEQSWHGLQLLLSRLGESRVRRNQQQLECLIVQSMICDNAQIAELALQRFLDRSLDEFTSHYYAEDGDDDTSDDLWSVSDSETEDAPHIPASIYYSQRLASFSRLDEVVPYLLESADYRALAQRITDRFEG